MGAFLAVSFFLPIYPDTLVLCRSAFCLGGVLVRGHALARRTGVGIVSLGLIGAALSASPSAARAAVRAGASLQARAGRPSVSKVSPSSGSTAGGTTVTVTGKNFIRVRGVDFGSARGGKLKVSSTTRLTVVAPRHAAGLAAIKVITAAGSSASVAADRFTYMAPPGRVTAAGLLTATPHTLTLAWTNPASKSLTGVTIRRATGSTPPRSVTSGQPVATTKPATTQYTVRALAAGTTYSFALFARGKGGMVAAADTLTVTTNRLLKVSTTKLPDGLAGGSYLAALTATGGVGPYTWTARGLPRGLALSRSGVLTGFPAGTGTSKVTVEATDAEHATATAALSLAVPRALPSACAAKSCSVVTDDGATIQVPAADVVSVTRDPTSGAVTGATLSGISVAAGDVLVFAAGPDLPTGLIAVAGTVTGNSDGSSTVTLTPGTVGDAYANGTVQALGGASNGIAGRARSQASSGNGALECSGGVSSTLHGLDVTHQLTPTLTAIWKHPLFKAGGFYPGTGGLSMFYAGLDGTVTVNMGITVSGSATCSLDLPSAQVAFPAGELGEVDLDVEPSLTFTVNGGIDVRASVTLQCGAYYEWTATGGNSGGRYCVPTYTPPKLSAPGGIDASLKGGLDVSLTLDDTTGVSGSIDATAHLGFHPGQHPAAELDVSSDWDIQGVLAKWWKDGPTVTIASGTLLDHKIIWSSDRPPPATPPVITTTHLPAATVGQHYSTQLTTADHRLGTWAITAGHLPAGLSLSGATVSGTPTTAGASAFTLRFTDTGKQTATAAATLTVAPASGWTSAEAPFPAGAASNSFQLENDIACGAAGSCTAVGYYVDPTTGQENGLIQTLANGHWSALTAPVPSQLTDTYPAAVALYSVACPSTASCIAVGTHEKQGGSLQPDALVIETLAGGTWTATEAPLPAGASDPALETITCVSAAYCVAVGQYTDSDDNQEPLIETLSNGTWAATAAPLPGTGSSRAELPSVSCVAVGTCVAVGMYTDGNGHPEGLIETLSSGSWTARPAPLPADADVASPPGGEPMILASVDCPAVGSCVASGSYPTSQGTWQGLLEQLSGGTWTPTSAPLPADAATPAASVFTQIACRGAESCLTIGWYSQTDGALSGVQDTLSGGTWTAADTPTPDNSGISQLESAACASTGCAVVGYYGTGVNSMIAADFSGTWTATKAPGPGNAGTGTNSTTALSNVTCTPSGYCAAIGIYKTTIGYQEDMIETR
jgi:hypothetical protein